jgi:hypothetical protein
MRGHGGNADGQAIGRSLGDGVDTDVAAAAWFVFNDDGAQRIFHTLRHQAGGYVDGAAGGIGHDDAHDLGLGQRKTG